MYNVEEFKITLLPEADRLRVIRSLRAVCSQKFTLSDITMIANAMLRGSNWSPTPEILRADPRTSDLAKIANIEADLRPDPYAEQNKKRAEEQALLEAGANGDAESAIRFCKELLAGTISYGYACG